MFCEGSQENVGFVRVVRRRFCEGSQENVGFVRVVRRMYVL